MDAQSSKHIIPTFLVDKMLIGIMKFHISSDMYYGNEMSSDGLKVFVDCMELVVLFGWLVQKKQPWTIVGPHLPTKILPFMWLHIFLQYVWDISEGTFLSLQRLYSPMAREKSSSLSFINMPKACNKLSSTFKLSWKVWFV